MNFPIQRRAFSGTSVLFSCGLVAGMYPSWLRAQPGQAVLQVGPGRTIKTLATAARVATDGSVIEVDAGEYIADVAVWERDALLIRAVGGRVRLIAEGAAAERKGIWVVRASGMRVEGFDFEGAAVPSRNGAGIRFDKGSLHVKNCRFMHNEMGLLTNNDPDTTLEVENCEFAYNHRPDGHNHNLYVGAIARLHVTGSYFHHARTGHLLKTRAAVNHIVYNRLTDEPEGTASYELEFPNGGEAYVIGNLIAQSTRTENRHLISFGAEGYRWQRNALHLVHNTLVNPLPAGGVYLRVAPNATVLQVMNNLLVGPGTLDTAGPGDYRHNYAARAEDFVDPPTFDYRLQHGSRLVGLATDPGRAKDQSLRQEQEYVHPHSTRVLTRAAHNPGAMQSLAP